MTDRKRVPAWENLDSRLLLSTATAAMPDVSAEIMQTSRVRDASAGHVRLGGSATGSYQNNQASASDAPDVYTLNGLGTLTVGGRHGRTTQVVQVDGFAVGTGFTRQGRSTGALTLRTAGGEVTIDLRGPIQRGFQPPAGRLHYMIRAGSGIGAFAGASGSGTVRLELAPGDGSSAFGRFNLRFV